MNESIQIKMHINNENKLEAPTYLEDIPDYEKKLKAWEFVNLPEEDRIAKTALLRASHGIGSDSPIASCNAINREVGFRRAVPNKSSIHYLRPDELKEYYKDILDKDGNLLSSKFSQKAA